jgi:glycosyltransferase involved in cell wall biosynthesis
MRVLVVHNRYRSEMPSGENRVVDDEVQLLRDHGVDVDTYVRSSDEIADFGPLERLTLATRPIYSPQDVRDFTATLTRFRPDVVHLHNPFPLISPWVVRVAKHAGVPVVQTVHNYRHSCPSGTFFRDGKVCTSCHGKKVPWPSVAHGCYRNSRAQSAVMATAARVHRPTWETIDHFLPVSRFVAGTLVESGIPNESITVKPNFVADPGPPGSIGEGFVFAGRLDEAKGIRLLLEAWGLAGMGERQQLVIAGDGPERDAVRAAVRTLPGVSYLGQVDGPRVARLLDAAAVLVVPSIWYEGLPRIVVEALSRGRPVLGTTIGSLSETIDDHVGWTSEPAALSLASGLIAAADQEAQRARSRGARLRYEDGYRPTVVFDVLSTVYAGLAGSARVSVDVAT